MHHYSLKDLQDRISDFLTDNYSQTLSISGAWGVGKTFAWDSEFKKFKDGNKDNQWCQNYAYVSLFGINDIQSLKSKIVFDKNIDDTAKNIGGFLSKIASSFTFKGSEANILLGGIAGAVGSIASMGKDIYIDSALKDKLICIDDLERSKIDLHDLLGFISFLTQKRNCKIVIIYNEEKFINNAYEIINKIITEDISIEHYKEFSESRNINRTDQKLLEALKGKYSLDQTEKFLYDALKQKCEGTGILKVIKLKMNKSLQMLISQK